MWKSSPSDLSASCFALELEMFSALPFDKNVSSSSVLNKKQEYPLNKASFVS